MVLGYFVENKMYKDNKIYANLNKYKKTISMLHHCQDKYRKVNN